MSLATPARMQAKSCPSTATPTTGFSKPARDSIRLIAGWGIEGDAHAGAYGQHRFLARRSPAQSNLRQVHLIQAELFPGLGAEGLRVQPGELGENITAQGLDLLTPPAATDLNVTLPQDVLLRADEVVEVG